jgi:hypothetical protein
LNYKKIKHDIPLSLSHYRKTPKVTTSTEIVN